MDAGMVFDLMEAFVLDTLAGFRRHAGVSDLVAPASSGAKASAWLLVESAVYDGKCRHAHQQPSDGYLRITSSAAFNAARYASDHIDVLTLGRGSGGGCQLDGRGSRVSESGDGRGFTPCTREQGTHGRTSHSTNTIITIVWSHARCACTHAPVARVPVLVLVGECVCTSWADLPAYAGRRAWGVGGSWRVTRCTGPGQVSLGPVLGASSVRHAADGQHGAAGSGRGCAIVSHGGMGWRGGQRRGSRQRHRRGSAHVGFKSIPRSILHHFLASPRFPMAPWGHP